MLQENRVVLVWGSPGSGKSYYVKQNMKNGDLVVDLDLIKQAISFKGKTEASDNLLPIALAIRDFIYEMIEYRMFDVDVWVIAGVPTQIERDYIINKLNIDEVVFIDKSKQVCIQQAIDDEERKNKNLQIKIIEKWFGKFEPPTE